MSAPSEPAPSDEAPKLPVPRWADRAFLLIGLVLLVYVLSRYPLADLARACLRLGPLVAVTPLIALGWIACNTSALHLLLDKQVPWLQLLRIRLIGDGYNALLPLAGMGGEPFKVKHLSAYVPIDRVLTALIRDRVLENGMGLLFTGLWLGVALSRFAFGSSLRVAVSIYVVVAALVGAGSILLVVTSLPGKASRLIARWLGVGAQSEIMLPPSKLARVLFWYLAARFTGTLEATVLLSLLGLGFDPVTILFCYSLLNAAGYLGFAIPQGLGVFEGTTVYLFGVLGFPGPLGVAFALARRARMLVVGLLGVLLHVSKLDPSVARGGIDR